MKKRRLLATGKPELLKNINVGLILDIIKGQGPISRAEIARVSGISPPTVSHLVNRLAQEGVVEEIGFGTSIGGRRPVLVRFNPAAAFVLGVDVGGSRCSAGLTDLAGRILAKEEVHYPPRGGERSLMIIEDLIRHLLEQAPGGRKKVRGIGLGVPGFVDSRQGRVLLAAGLRWENMALKEHLQNSFDLPVFLDNNVRTLLRGEKWFGQARGKENALYILIGLGIGAGVMIGGEIYPGTDQAAGEIRYTLLDRRALQLAPEPGGFLEGRVAAGGVTARAREGWMSTGSWPPSPVQTAGELKVSEVFAAAGQGDPLANKVTQEMVDYLGMTVVNLACLLNPEVVIFGGEVPEAYPELLERVRGIVSRFCPYPPALVGTELREDAGILGSVAGILAQERRTLSFLGYDLLA
ncbi:MAG: ROK family protein [Firmicutes bacterium]|nr:ROK family protein [Bacillota bacterium]